MAARKGKTGKAKRAAASKKAPAPRKKAPPPARRAPKARAVRAEDAVAADSPLASLPKGKLYYRIGEVAKITDVKPHVLRYWETEFRWMAPPKSRSKQRLYRRKDIEMIVAIKRLLYEERYTIAGARQQLRELGLGAASEAAEAPPEGTRGKGSKPSQEEVDAGMLAEQLRATYQRLRGELQEIRDLV